MGAASLEFLRHVVRHAGSRLCVIWDGSPIHRRALVMDFLHSPEGRGIEVERLPGPAPDLNPWDTGGWDHLKHADFRGPLITPDLAPRLHSYFGAARIAEAPLIAVGGGVDHIHLLVSLGRCGGRVRC
ncbi:transposase [Gemmata sp. JC673]|uniref:Transposase n=1 Tax=Gemmata algarum TaxID=2975278 RepID=A0ABU5F3E8_9BACT|nr:transposase [Gemmata algarum]MDY3562029.1 transposase [Gemmata algarum]